MASWVQSACAKMRPIQFFHTHTEVVTAIVARHCRAAHGFPRRVVSGKLAGVHELPPVQFECTVRVPAHCTRVHEALTQVILRTWACLHSIWKISFGSASMARTPQALTKVRHGHRYRSVPISWREDDPHCCVLNCESPRNHPGTQTSTQKA